MLSHFSHIRLSATPWTMARQAPLSMGILQARIQSGLPYLPPGDLPNPGIKPRYPSLQEDSLPSEPPGKHIYYFYLFKIERKMKIDPKVENK